MSGAWKTFIITDHRTNEHGLSAMCWPRSRFKYVEQRQGQV